MAMYDKGGLMHPLAVFISIEKCLVYVPSTAAAMIFQIM
jgi:hypothetical protein